MPRSRPRRPVRAPPRRCRTIGRQRVVLRCSNRPAIISPRIRTPPVWRSALLPTLRAWLCQWPLTARTGLSSTTICRARLRVRRAVQCRCRRFGLWFFICSQPRNEPRLWLDRIQGRKLHNRAPMAGYAEVALERLQHLNLARQCRLLDHSLRMNREAVTHLARPGTGADLGTADFALSDLLTRPSRRVGLARAKNEFGCRRRGHCCGLVTPIERAELGDRLKAEDGAKAPLTPAHNQRLKLCLSPEYRQLVGNNPNLFARLLRRHQAADQAIQ